MGSACPRTLKARPSATGQITCFHKAIWTAYPTGPTKGKCVSATASSSDGLIPARQEWAGFYDYPQGSEPDETADQAFAGLEAKFPVVPRELVSSDFYGWVKQLDLLLSL